MAEDLTTDESIFDSTSAEAGSPIVSTTDDQSKSESISEENEANLLDDPAEEAKQKQIDAWYKKIKSGVKSIDDLPKNQQWMRSFIEPRLKAEKPKEVDVEALLEAKLEAREEKNRFASLKESLKGLDLTAEQKADLQSEFKDLRSEGMPMDKALRTAMRLAGIRNDSPMSKMVPPRPSTLSTSPDEEVNMDNFREKLSRDDPRRIELLEKITDPTRAKAKLYRSK